MDESEITPVVEKREERVRFKSPNQQETRMENFHISGGRKSFAKWPTMNELLDPSRGPLFIPKCTWNVMFIVSCVVAVLLDPLFLYIPIIINEKDIKCLRSDNHLKIIALVLRSVTDLCYLLNIFFQVYSSSTNNSSALRRRGFSCSFSMVAKAKTMLHRNKFKGYSKVYLVIDILALLPIPQIVILIFYFNMRRSRSLGTRKLMNFFVLVQYVPRVIRIYLSCNEYKKSSREEISIWLKGVLNFFFYILAGHVIGAFWYFFAVQQITTCWQHACRLQNGCDPSNLYCDGHRALRNFKILDDLCSVDPPNEKLVIKFGIFLDTFQLGILESTNFFEKLSNCFCWGLRNLSSFGSNLKPSVNAGENLFAAFISIIGLLLFLYLIGNLQTYMQLDTERLETHRWKMGILKKMEMKSLEVEQWLSKNGIPSSKKSETMDCVKVELKANKEVDVENLLTILPPHLLRYVKRHMPLNRLKKVPLLENMDEGVLRAISEYLVPKKYHKNDIIIQEKEPLEEMIFIVEGLVIIELRDCTRPLKLSAEKVYGEKLLSWPAWTSFPNYLPLATESARADGDVEVLVLMASYIKNDEWLQSSLKSHCLNKGIARLTDDDWKLLETDQVTMLKKVPNLKNMDTRVLEAISEKLKPMNWEGNPITEGKPLRMMVFVTGGWTKGKFYGEELLDWVLDRSFPAILPISTHSVSLHNADFLVLTAKDLGDVVSNFMSHFSKEITIGKDYSLDLCATVGLTWLRKGPSIFQSMDEEVLKVISKHLKLISYSVNTYIVGENDPLEYMFIFVEGSSMSIENNHWPCKQEIGGFYGEEIVYWVTNWASHGSYPNKFPLSTSNVMVDINDNGNAGVLVLLADDLKSIVSQFRSQFIKQFSTLPVDSEGKLSTFDMLATLRKVPQLKHMDEEKLEQIRSNFVPMRYYDRSPPYIIEGGNSVELDKMVVIQSGVVSVRSIKGGEKVYRYSGDYFGDELLKWALHLSPAHDRSLPKSDIWVEAVGEVEVLMLKADDMKRLFRETSDNNISSLQKEAHKPSDGLFKRARRKSREIYQRARQLI